MSNVSEKELGGLTEAQVERFLEDPVWRILDGIIEDRIKDAHIRMEHAPMDDEWGDYTDSSGNTKYGLLRVGFRRLQGEIQGLRFAVEQPQSFLDELKEERNHG